GASAVRSCGDQCLTQPPDLGFWSRWIGHLPTPSYQIGASLPSFAVAFLLTALAVTLGSPRAAARPRREPRARPGCRQPAANRRWPVLRGTRLAGARLASDDLHPLRT